MSNDDIDEQINNVINRLSAIELEARSAREELSKLIRKKKRDESKLKTDKHTDRHGTPIRKGCKVRYLTKGRYKSTEGKVTELKDDRVITVDRKGNTIWRSHNNVEVILDE